MLVVYANVGRIWESMPLSGQHLDVCQYKELFCFLPLLGVIGSTRHYFVIISVDDLYV